MATSPAFAATPHTGAALLTGTESDMAVPTSAFSVFAAGTNGSKVEELIVTAYATTLIPTTVAGLVYFWIYNGTTYFVWDVFPVTAITASYAAAGFRLSRPYNNLILQSGWTLYAGQSASANASHLIATAVGGDY